MDGGLRHYTGGSDQNHPQEKEMHGEENGNPLQYSCLENSMDRGAWWATVHGVTKNQSWLNDFYTHTSYM